MPPKIIYIQVAIDVTMRHFCYGLGEDNKIYFWDWTTTEWKLYINPEVAAAQEKAKQK